MSSILLALVSHPGHGTRIEHIAEHAVSGSWWIAVVAGFATLMVIMWEETMSKNG